MTNFPAKVKASNWTEVDRPYYSEMKRMENWLRSKDRSLYVQVTRRSSEQATEKDIQYLKNKGIPVRDNLTRETARLLKDDQRIKNKLSKVE